MKLKDKVAIVTGGTSGVGKAVATLFAKEGAKVVIAGRNAKKGQEAELAIGQAGGVGKFVRADVTQISDAEGLVAEAVREYGRLDILHNNAGIYILGSATDLSEEDWDRMFRTNVKGYFLCAKFAIREMMKNPPERGGVIIQTSSISGLVGLRNSLAYCASKAAVVNMTKALALDCAPYNIRVNCICPSGVAGTGMTKATLERLESMTHLGESEIMQSWSKAHPLGRMVTPEDVAKAALFLASDQSSYITGSVLLVDGGRLASAPSPAGL